MTNLRIPNFWDGFFGAFQPMDEDPMELYNSIKAEQKKYTVRDTLRNDWINVCKDFRKAYDKVTAQYK